MAAEIRGVDQFAALSKRLKEVADKDLGREFSRGISAATRPVIRGLRQAALDTLPSRGGLAERVSKTKIRAQRRNSSRSAGVRIVARDPYYIDRLDQGRLRHPVFADADKERKSWRWVNQRVKPGWWTRPAELAAESTRVRLEHAMKAIQAKLDRPL